MVSWMYILATQSPKLTEEILHVVLQNMEAI